MEQEYKFSLKGMLRFELISLYGRRFLPAKKPPIKQGKNYLNLGCGSNIKNSDMGGGKYH